MTNFISNIKVFAMCMTIATLFAPAFAQTSPEAAAAELGGLSESVSNNIQDPTLYVPKYNNEQTGNGDLYGEGELVPIDPGNAKVTGCANNPADPNLYTRQECEGVNFVARNRTIRPNMTVTTRDPIISGNRAITSDPRETLEKFKWIVPTNADGSFGSLPANACPATTVNTPPIYEDRRCTFYKGSENFLCKAPLKVTVDPQFNYQCQDTLGVNSTEKCSKILNVQCTGGGWNPGCSTAGVVPHSAATDFVFTYTHTGDGFYSLEYGAINDDYLHGDKTTGAFYDRILNIDIQGIERLDTFKLDNLLWDDWVWMKVNGQSVFLGSPAIDRVEPTAGNEQRCSNRKCIRYGPGPTHVARAERGRSERAYPNMDLKPLLHNGTNQIWFRVAVGGGGEMYTKFVTRMACPVNCTESWNNQCTTLEQRAR